jgi:glycerol uptake facilitator-like aquaporin
MLLIFLGNSACANVYLSRTKGNNSGWIVICFGWAFAVDVPAYIFEHPSIQINFIITFVHNINKWDKQYLPIN